MDASDGAKNNGNGKHVPEPGSLPSTPSAGGNGHPPEPLVVVELPAAPPRDAKGRILPGHSLNPKGKPKGIPNRNAELVRIVNSGELRKVWAMAKAQAKKGDNGLLQFLLARALLEQSPTAAGIVINTSASASAQASATSETNLHDRLEELRDPGVLAGVGDLLDRLAARRGITGAPRHGN